MKKLLTILGSVAIVATTGAVAVACNKKVLV
ncbi:lipoprotein [Mycoplasma sp. HU2014]|nr:lipoprotein [Mycoplasma sp. HU2014]